MIEKVLCVKIDSTGNSIPRSRRNQNVSLVEYLAVKSHVFESPADVENHMGINVKG